MIEVNQVHFGNGSRAAGARLLSVIACGLGLVLSPGCGGGNPAPTGFKTLARYPDSIFTYGTAGVVPDNLGNLFGVATLQSGRSSTGIVYKYSPRTGITTVATFSGQLSGLTPTSSLTGDGKGNYFGLAYGNYPQTSGNAQGAVFEYSTSNGQLSVLAAFPAKNSSSFTAPLVVDANGNLYGCSTLDGIHGYGYVFEVVRSSNTFVDLADFNLANGLQPSAGLVTDGKGNFFGTTSEGGSMDMGTVFEYNVKSGLTTLASFTGSNGQLPGTGVVLDAEGNLYGATLFGGSGGYGDIYKVTPGSGTAVDIADFQDTPPGIPIGQIPSGYVALTMSTDGSLYGVYTNVTGVDPSYIFHYSNSTGITKLATFAGYSGYGPDSPMVFDTLGNLYGSTGPAELNNDGSIFEIYR